jgi:hypothetical protein
MAVSKVIKRMGKNSKMAKKSRVINPFAKDLPSAMAKKKFEQRPIRRTAKTPLSRVEKRNKPLRKSKFRYGGR